MKAVDLIAKLQEAVAQNPDVEVKLMMHHVDRVLACRLAEADINGGSVWLNDVKNADLGSYSCGNKTIQVVDKEPDPEPRQVVYQAA